MKTTVTREEILEKINEKIPNYECPMCKGKEFSILDCLNIFKAILIKDFCDKDFSSDFAKHYLPVCTFICNNCGFITSHCIRRINLIDRKEESKIVCFKKWFSRKKE